MTINEQTDLSEIPVSLLSVGNRALNVFRRYGIRTIEDLIANDPCDLKDMRGFGPGCLQETIEALREHGLRLKPIDYEARR